MSDTLPDVQEGFTLACGQCDCSSELRRRQDGVVRCYNCGGSMNFSDLLIRKYKRGSHGGKSAAFMRKIAEMPRGPRTDSLADSD